MRVLVTGGAGYIGSLVVRELLESDYRPVVLDSLYWGDRALGEVADRIEFINGDCRSSKDLIYALEGVDAVIHLAGIVGEPACKINPKAHHTINIESTKTLIDLCTDPNLDLIRDFIFVSSCSVYGNVKGLHDVVTEQTPTSPLSLYAAAKLDSERIIMERAALVPHFRPTILRLTTVFGYSPRPRLDLVTNLFAYRAIKEGRITIFGDGMQYRSLIHVADVANAVVETLKAPAFARAGQTFHVGEEENNKTVRRIAEIVKEIEPAVELEFKAGQPTDRRDYRISCQKIKNVIGWQARRSVEDGVREMIDRLRNDGRDWESPLYRNNLYDYR